jgi:MoxR-like ATPase
LLQYIAQIVQQTRSSRAVYLGASPRASVAILQTSKAFALLQGRDFVTPEDIKFVTPSVLQHRLILTAEAEMEGYTSIKVAQKLIDKVEVPK